jgi:voltage-gated potassium channel Kch
VTDALTLVPGLLIIAATVWEVFQDLFHPAHGGALSDWIARGYFHLLRRRRSLLPLAGPVALVSVIAIWVVLLVVGFALVYYSWYPAEFRTSTAALPPESPHFAAVLYYSFETLVTLGYGDLVPQATALRFTAAVEALIGFGLLTASVSAIVLIYPALARMRVLARGVAALVDAERRAGISVAESGAHEVLERLARDVVHARTDLVHFPLIYYFAAADENASALHWTNQLARMAQEGASAERPAQMRLAAAALDRALSDFADLLADRFVHAEAGDRDAVFEAVARDHAVSVA